MSGQSLGEERHLASLPVHVIVNLAIKDALTYRKYERGFFPLLKRFGGEFITYDDAPITLEGSAPPTGRVVMFQFPSEAQCKSWYADVEYQALSEHRRAGTDLQFLVVVHSLRSRSPTPKRGESFPRPLMSDVPVYMIGNLEVSDPAEYLIYEKGTFPIAKRYEGELITFDDNPKTLEGVSPPPGRLIISKFPSEAHARGWFADLEYQALAAHRRAGTRLHFLTLVHALPVRTNSTARSVTT